MHSTPIGTVKAALIARAVLKICGRVELSLRSKSFCEIQEYGLWPLHVFPTEVCLEEWRFGELKKISSILFLESFELLIERKGPENILADCYWLVQKTNSMLLNVNREDAVRVLNTLCVCKRIYEEVTSIPKFASFAVSELSPIFKDLLMTMTNLLDGLLRDCPGSSLSMLSYLFTVVAPIDVLTFFRAVMREIMEIDPLNSFLTCDLGQNFFNTAKGKHCLPNPFVFDMIFSPIFHIRVFSTIRSKDIVRIPQFCDPILSQSLHAFTNSPSDVSSTIVLMILCIGNRFQLRQLLYLFLSRASNNALEFASRIVLSAELLPEQDAVRIFTANACAILAPSIAANSSDFSEAVALVEALPLTQTNGVKQYFEKFCGHFGAKFIKTKNYSSFDEMCALLDSSRQDIILRGFSQIVVELFSMKNATTAATWCTHELGGPEILFGLVKRRLGSIISDLVLRFDASLPFTYDFAMDPEMQQLREEILQRGKPYSCSPERISGDVVIEVLQTIIQLGGDDSLSKLITHWDAYSALLSTCEQVESNAVIFERQHFVRNGLVLLVILMTGSLASSLLLQLSLTSIVKFAAGSKNYIKILNGISQVVKLRTVESAMAVAQVFPAIVSAALERIARGESEDVHIRFFEQFLQWLDGFEDAQTLCLIFLDSENLLFNTIFENFGKMMDRSDLSIVIEKAIEFSVAGSEAAIISFIFKCLKNGREFLSVSRIVPFLLGMITSSASSDHLKMVSLQCLVMITPKLSKSVERTAEVAPKRRLMTLLASNTQKFEPNFARLSIAVMFEVCKGKNENWLTHAAGTSSNTIFEFFRANCPEWYEAKTLLPLSGTLKSHIWIEFHITEIVKNLITAFQVDQTLSACLPVSEIDPEIAKALFPLLLHEILVQKNPDTIPKTRREISKCFKVFFDNMQQQGISSVKTAVSAIDYLRLRFLESSCFSSEKAFWLDIDYQTLARAALLVRDKFLSLYFYELSSQFNSNHNLLLEIYRDLDIDAFGGVMGFLELSDSNILESFNMHNDSFKSISLWNAKVIYSLVSEFYLIYFCEFFGIIPKSITDSVFSASSPSTSDVELRSIFGFSESLSKSGLYYGISRGTVGNAELQELQYQSLWRCGKWDFVEANSSDFGVNRLVFEISRAIHLGELKSSLPHIQAGFIKSIASLNLDSAVYSPNALSSIMPIVKFHEFNDLVGEIEATDTSRLKLIFAAWNDRSESFIRKLVFRDFESTLYCRILSLLALVKSNRTAQNFEQLSKTIFWYTKLARKSNVPQYAMIGVSMLKAVDALNGHSTSFQHQFELAKILHSQGSHSIAIKMLKQIVSSYSSSNNFILAKLNRKLAKWCDMHHSENPQTIFAYFQQSAMLAKALPKSSEMCACFYEFASFADRTYSSLVANEMHNKMKVLVQERQHELDDLTSKFGQKADDPSIRTTIRRLNNQLRFDRAEILAYNLEIEQFLLQSVENYFLCLQIGSKWDVSVFRICALWFSNYDSSKLNTLMKQHFQSGLGVNGKFLPLIYQLSARMSTENDPFQAILKELLSNMISNYPYQTLYQIIALKNSGLSDPAQAKSLNGAAAELLQSLKRKNIELRSIIDAADNLSEAYIELAKITPPSSMKRGRFNPVAIERRLKLARIVDTETPVITVRHPIGDPSNCRELPTVQKFLLEYQMVGGINAPKLVVCVGSDGNEYKQVFLSFSNEHLIAFKLVKGGSDDLRQDATLSNVFSMMNVLLKKNVECRQRDLKVETYRIVPLSQRAGVIEWLDNTVPIGEYLNIAHAKYNKGDILPVDARKKMMAEHEADLSTPESKLKVYLEIERKFRPVFRHFFFETFHDPFKWFQCRTLYTRSSAVSSVVGWIVGLGDRHPQNTLINRSSGAVIQIDLGIAFDQGKLLSFPELVPFRLTRDIVDGMGSTGVEGIFRRCSELTLNVARKEANIIFTILDVFKYDPLYHWRGAYSQVQGVINAEADRALVGVKKKLSDSLSVECEINDLVLSAVDKRNLSKMFPGWYVHIYSKIVFI
ncbi:hypothetical protein HDU83_003529 [Entophlyctis luteolus]|nr:hypothetical protein HDU83_003529 [Entophlyctis luteolus]